MPIHWQVDDRRAADEGRLLLWLMSPPSPWLDAASQRGGSLRDQAACDHLGSVHAATPVGPAGVGACSVGQPSCSFQTTSV
jgi:hypothetical protein